MEIQKIFIILATVITIIAMGLPKKYKWVSVGLLLVAITVVVAGIIVSVLL